MNTRSLVCLVFVATGGVTAQVLAKSPCDAINDSHQKRECQKKEKELVEKQQAAQRAQQEAQRQAQLKAQQDAQRKAQLRAQQEAQRQAQLKAKQEKRLAETPLKKNELQGLPSVAPLVPGNSKNPLITAGSTPSVSAMPRETQLQARQRVDQKASAGACEGITDGQKLECLSKEKQTQNQLGQMQANTGNAPPFVPNLNDPVYSDPKQNPFALDRAGKDNRGQCTAFAFARAYEITGKKIRVYGDAKSWWKQSQAKYQTGQEPKRGAIAVWEGDAVNPHGHVAVVEDVRRSGQTVMVKMNEANIWPDRPSDTDGRGLGYNGAYKERALDKWKDRGTGVGKLLGYIYLN